MTLQKILTFINPNYAIFVVKSIILQGIILNECRLNKINIYFFK